MNQQVTRDTDFVSPLNPQATFYIRTFAFVFVTL